MQGYCLGRVVQGGTFAMDKKIKRLKFASVLQNNFKLEIFAKAASNFSDEVMVWLAGLGLKHWPYSSPKYLGRVVPKLLI